MQLLYNLLDRATIVSVNELWNPVSVVGFFSLIPMRALDLDTFQDSPNETPVHIVVFYQLFLYLHKYILFNPPRNVLANLTHLYLDTSSAVHSIFP